MMRLRRGEMEKVVPVTGQEYATGLMRKTENGLVGGIARKCFTQQGDLVPELFQKIAQVIGNFMIEEELQYDAEAIWRATSKSISPRWSS